jgi:HAE1 family hydrophobic/amphiphilic exporter-1
LLVAKEISFTVLSMTLSLGAIFIPIVFMPGLIGRMFHEMAVTIVLAIIFSGVVAIVVSPMVCARLLRKSEGENRYQRWFNRYFSAFKARYKRSLEWMIERKGLALLVWLLSLGGTIWLFVVIPSGSSGGRQRNDQGCYSPRKAPLPHKCRRTQKQLMEIAKAEPGVDQVITATGLQNNQLTTSMGLFIVLLAGIERAPIAEITQRIINKVRQQVRA